MRLQKIVIAKKRSLCESVSLNRSIHINHLRETETKTETKTETARDRETETQRDRRQRDHQPDPVYDPVVEAEEEE